MIIQSERFGAVEVPEERVITIRRGLVGFPADKRWAMVQPNDGSPFFWLQSVDTPALAFVVTDPQLFVEGYRVPAPPDALGRIGLADIDDAVVLVIVNRRDGYLTGNLQGPIVINADERLAEQFVLASRRSGLSTRHPLCPIGRERAV